MFSFTCHIWPRFQTRKPLRHWNSGKVYSYYIFAFSPSFMLFRASDFTKMSLTTFSFYRFHRNDSYYFFTLSTCQFRAFWWILFDLTTFTTFLLFCNNSFMLFSASDFTETTLTNFSLYRPTSFMLFLWIVFHQNNSYYRFTFSSYQFNAFLWIVFHQNSSYDIFAFSPTVSCFSVPLISLKWLLLLSCFIDFIEITLTIFSLYQHASFVLFGESYLI